MKGILIILLFLPTPLLAQDSLSPVDSLMIEMYCVDTLAKYHIIEIAAMEPTEENIKLALNYAFIFSENWKECIYKFNNFKFKNDIERESTYIWLSDLLPATGNKMLEILIIKVNEYKAVAGINSIMKLLNCVTEPIDCLKQYIFKTK
jgi:hypothetical protein